MQHLCLPELLACTEKATVVADNPMFIRALEELGLDAVLLGNIERLPERCLALPFSVMGARQFYERAARTHCKQSILCPLYAFNPDLETALYTLMLLLRSDFSDCLKRQRDYLKLLTRERRLQLIGINAQARVRFHASSTPFVTTREELNKSFVLSINELFEVHYAHMRPENPDLFEFDGLLRVSGVLASLGSCAIAPTPALKSEVQGLIEDVARHEAWLYIKRNQVCSFKVAGQERLALVSRAVGKRGLHLSEFAIGVNDAIAAHLDYAINSPMNEGVSGVHVGLGDGASGYHLDFLSHGVSLQPY